jgi:hypothetical protein
MPWWAAANNELLSAAEINWLDTRAFCHGRVADHWEGLDADAHPFIARLADQLRIHDDRQQSLAGVDIILNGVIQAAEPDPETDRTG